MKRTITMTLALGLLLATLGTSDALARSHARKDKQKPTRTEMPADYLQPHKFDRLPAMQFYSGRLVRDGMSGWRVGNYTLQTSPQTVVTDAAGDGAMLEEGREAIVMGVAYGPTLSAWTVRMSRGDMPSTSLNSDLVKEPSDGDPEVGRIVSGPR
jgi:hypothetical protein